jgi:L-lysine 6-transaminase
MCAVDAPDTRTRDQLLKALLREKLLLVGSGERSIRFRPHLIVSAGEIAQAAGIMRSVLKEGDYPGLETTVDVCPAGT